MIARLILLSVLLGEIMLGSTPTVLADEPASAPVVGDDALDFMESRENSDIWKLLEANRNLNELLGEVNSVSRRAESALKAPATVSVIDERQIRLSGARTIPDLLRQVPGVQVFVTSPGNATVSLRGMGGLQANNVVVLLDGFPVNLRMTGDVDWASLPVHIDDIARIEVVRGPVSTIYGANAYTGVINILTRQLPTQRVGEKQRLTIGAAAHGGTDTRASPAADVSATVLGRTGIFSGKLAITGQYDDAWTRSRTVDLRLPPARALGGKLDLRLDLSKRVAIELNGGLSYNDRSGLDHLVTSPVRNQTTFGFLQLHLAANQLTPVLEAINVWARGRTQQLHVDPSAAFGGITLDGMNAFDGELLTDIDLRFAKAWHMVISANAGGAVVDAPYLHPDERKRPRAYYGLRVGGDVDLFGALSISAAVRADISSFIADPIALSGRVALTYYSDRFSVRLSGGSAFREPTYIESAARFVDPQLGIILLEGSSSLLSPRIYSAELGVMALLASRLQLRGTVYYARLDSLVFEDFGPLVRKSFRNQGSRDLIGVEAEALLDLADSVKLRAGGSGLIWINAPLDQPTTVGDPRNNSTFTGFLGVTSLVWHDRIGLGANVSLATGRTFSVRAGLPPQIINVVIPVQAKLDVSADIRVARSVPLWLGFKGSMALPYEQFESPFPSSGLPGVTLLLHAFYRKDFFANH